MYGFLKNRVLLCNKSDILPKKIVVHHHRFYFLERSKLLKKKSKVNKKKSRSFLIKKIDVFDILDNSLNQYLKVFKTI